MGFGGNKSPAQFNALSGERKISFNKIFFGREKSNFLINLLLHYLKLYKKIKQIE